MSSVAYANKILDEAERKLLKNYSKAEFIELINKSWNIVSNSSQYQLAKLGERVSDFKKAGGVATAVIGVVSGVGNVVISNANDEDKIETLIGAGVDLILLGVGFIPGVGPVVNLAMIGATALGIDPATKIKQWHRNEQIDSLDWVTITKSGFLQVTMPDGTVYARPFMPNAQGSLFGNGKDDVLFGGNEKDIFIRHGGNDIFVGNGGKDDYLVSYGDTIIDSDGKGRVFLGSSHQLKGGTQIEFQKQDEKLKYEKQIKDISVFLENEKDMRENLSELYADTTKAKNYIARLNESGEKSKIELLNSLIKTIQKKQDLTEHILEAKFMLIKANLMAGQDKVCK